MEQIGMNERMRAFITARFYREFKERFGERGQQAFVMATQIYGEQRGRRMAERAIRAGEPLTLATYLRRGEWVNTEAIRNEGIANQAELVSEAPGYGTTDGDYVKKVTRCPWHEQFREMGELEAGTCYCRHIDPSLYRGFDPLDQYEVPQSLNGSGCCYHIVRHAAAPEKLPPKDPAGLRSFEYHCADSYWAYRRTAEHIFGEAGREAAEAVLDAVRGAGPKLTGGASGEAAAQRLLQYRDTDFTSCDSREV